VALKKGISALTPKELIQEVNTLSREKMEEFLERIPPIEREVYDHHIKGMTQSSLATLYGMTQPAIHYRINRVRRRLVWMSRIPMDHSTFEKNVLSMFNASRVPNPLRATKCVTTAALNGQANASRKLGIHSGTIHVYVTYARKHLDALSRAYLAHMSDSGGRFYLPKQKAPKRPCEG
jgi:hypothetical protein